jgi:hypothetical protein
VNRMDQHSGAKTYACQMDLKHHGPEWMECVNSVGQ